MPSDVCDLWEIKLMQNYEISLMHESCNFRVKNNAARRNSTHASVLWRTEPVPPHVSGETQLDPPGRARGSGREVSHPRTVIEAPQPRLLTPTQRKRDVAVGGASQRAHPTQPLGEAAGSHPELLRLREAQAQVEGPSGCALPQQHLEVLSAGRGGCHPWRPGCRAWTG